MTKATQEHDVIRIDRESRILSIRAGAEHARLEMVRLTGMVSDCCGTAVLNECDGRGMCADCLEPCYAITVPEKPKRNKTDTGAMLYDLLESAGAERMCEAIMSQNLCELVDGPEKCEYCPFKTDEILQSEMRSMEFE